LSAEQEQQITFADTYSLIGAFVTSICASIKISSSSNILYPGRHSLSSSFTAKWLLFFTRYLVGNKSHWHLFASEGFRNKLRRLASLAASVTRDFIQFFSWWWTGSLYRQFISSLAMMLARLMGFNDIVLTPMRN